MCGQSYGNPLRRRAKCRTRSPPGVVLSVLLVGRGLTTLTNWGPGVREINRSRPCPLLNPMLELWLSRPELSGPVSVGSRGMREPQQAAALIEQPIVDEKFDCPLCGSPERNHQRLGSHGDSRSEASSYQGAQNGMSNKRRATPGVVLVLQVPVLEEDWIVDSRHMSGQVVVGTEELRGAVDAERVLQPYAIEHVDKDRAHRPRERA